ncbi:hypothetical protein [Gracilimonas sediminicola]|uniref:hypothetical protein n=1 Tax=Gracilimonas sediminicola TaxID=2952158 RepID=UPI0038D507B9
MSSDVVYISPEIKKAISEISKKRFGVEPTHIGLILLQNHKKEFKKQGIEVASDFMSFIIFDNKLNKVGVIKRSDLKKGNSQ